MGQRSVYIALLAVQLLFATAPIAVKIALRELSSPALAMLRVIGAALLFLLLQRLLEQERILSRADYLRLAWYALFGVVLNQTLYITALTRTTATAAQTLVTAGPALTLLVAIALRRERPTGGKWLGIALAAIGALYLVGLDLSAEGGGSVLILLNVLAFSVYLVISRDILARYSPLTVITWIFVFGTFGIAPLGVPALLVHSGPISGTTWLALGWLILAPTVGAYYLNQWSLKRVEASTVAVFAYLQPVGTALLAIPMLDERPSLRMIPAAALIFLGVWITAQTARRAAPAPAV